MSLAVAIFGMGVVGSPAAQAADPLLWQRPVLIDPGGGPLTSISCSGRSFCAAVDGSGDVLTSPKPAGGPGAWSSSRVTVPLAGVSCVSTALCVAVGPWNSGGPGVVVTSTDPSAGGGWTVSPIDPQNPLTSVSCPSTTLCVAVGWHGTVAISTQPAGGAGAWRIYQAPTQPVYACGKYGPVADCHADLTAVSCSSVSLCVAADNSGGGPGANGNMEPSEIISFTDPAAGVSGWTVTAGGIASPLISLSCPATSLCAGVDRAGAVFTSTTPTGESAHWVSPFNSGGDAVSCGSKSLCVASGNSALVDTSVQPFGGRSAWTASDIADGRGFEAVSCYSTQLCVAVTGTGNDVEPGYAVVGMPPTIAQIRTALKDDIRLPRPRTRVRELLARGGVRLAVRAPAAGRLRIAWYMPRTTAQSIGSKSKRILVARGTANFAKTGTVVMKIKLTRLGKAVLQQRGKVSLLSQGTFAPIYTAPVLASTVIRLRR